MKAKKKAKLDLIGKDTLIAGIDVGKKKHYCRFINLRGYEIGKVFSCMSRVSRYVQRETVPPG